MGVGEARNTKPIARPDLAQLPAARPADAGRPTTTVPQKPPTAATDTPAAVTRPAALDPSGRPRETAATTVTPGQPGTVAATPQVSDGDAAKGRQLAEQMLQTRDRLATAGLRVDVNHAAEEAPVTTTRQLPLRELTATLYGVPADRVTDQSLAAVRQQNPGLQGDTFATGAQVNIAGTPASLQLAHQHLDLMRLAAGTAPGEQPVREAIDARLVEVRGAERAPALEAQLRTTATLADRLVRDSRPEGIPVAYERLRRDVQSAVQNHQLSSAQASMALVGINVSEANATLAASHAMVDTFVSRRTELKQTADKPVMGDELGIAGLQNIQALQDFDKTRMPTVQRLQQNARASIERLQALRNTPGLDASQLDSAIARVRDESRDLEARVHIATGENHAAERLFLPQSLTRSEVLAPDVQLNIDENGRSRGFFGTLLNSTTHVGALTVQRRTALTNQIAGLPPAERQQAVDGLLRLSSLYSGADDITHQNTTRQLITEVAQRTGDRPLAMRASLITAQTATRERNFDEARRQLDAAAQQVNALANDDQKRSARFEIATSRIAVERVQASGGNDDAARAAADRLHALRVGYESNGPLSRDQLARLSLLEAQTFLSQNRAAPAGDAVRNLDRYSELPWARQAGDAFRHDHTESGITAALKVGLRAANSESMLVSAGTTLGAGAAGAVIGAFAGGPVGAGVGFMIGSAVGGIGVSAIGVARHWDDVSQAMHTGMTSLTARDAIVDGAFLGINLAASAAPLGGASRLAATGLTRAGIMTALRTSAAELGTNLTEQELKREASRVLMREFGRGTATWGGRPLAAASMAALVGPAAAEFIQIQQIKDPNEKRQAEERLARNLGQGALVVGATMLAGRFAGGLTLRGGMRWPVEPPVAHPHTQPIQAPVVHPTPHPVAEPTIIPGEGQIVRPVEAQVVRPTETAPAAAHLTSPQLDQIVSTLRSTDHQVDLMNVDQLRGRQVALDRMRQRAAESPVTPERDRALKALDEGSVRLQRELKSREWARQGVEGVNQRIGDIIHGLDATRQRLRDLGTWREDNGQWRLESPHDLATIANNWSTTELETARGMLSAWPNVKHSLELAHDSTRPLVDPTPSFNALRDDVARLEVGERAVQRLMVERVLAGENLPGSLISHYRGEQAGGVRYLDAQQRQQYEVTVRDGRLYDAQGKPISTQQARSEHSGQGVAIFVLSPDGKLYVSMDHAVGRFHHSTFLAGGDVLAAGEVVVDNGRITAFSDRSGHYAPSLNMSRQFSRWLRGQGIDPDNVRFSGHDTNAPRNAGDLLRPPVQP